MKSETPIDYAVFQLSPKRSRCELFVSSNGNVEKLASGLVKPFTTHLKVAEDQAAHAVQFIKLEAEKRRNAKAWFTKGTLERFVRFVSTPEVLESVNTYDAEMSQLEGARKIYSQGVGDQHSGAIGAGGSGSTAAADATKRELLRAIDVRLTAVQQDLTVACARASAAGFNPESISELQQFSDQFGAHRLNDACTKFISLCQRRTDLVRTWKPNVDDQVVRASWGSDMSIDDPVEEQSGPRDSSVPHQPPENKHQEQQSHSAIFQQSESALTTEQHIQNKNKEEKTEENVIEPLPIQSGKLTRRLSVQERINLFENKQKENSGGKPVAVGKSAELRRLSSDVSSAPGAAERAVLRRWSGASDMSIDLGNDKKDNSTDSPLCTPTTSSQYQAKSNGFPCSSSDKDQKDQNSSSDKASSGKVEQTKGFSGASDPVVKDQGGLARSGSLSGEDENNTLKGHVNRKENSVSQSNQFSSFMGKVEQSGTGNPGVPSENNNTLKGHVNRKENSVSQSNQFSSFMGKVEQSGTGNPGVPSENVKSSSVGDEREISTVQFNTKIPQAQVGGKLGDATSQGGTRNRVETAEPESHSLAQAQARFRGSFGHNRSLSGQLDDGFGLRTREAQKGTEDDQLAPQVQWKSFRGGVEEVGRKEIPSSEKKPSKVEDVGVNRMKVQKPIATSSEQTKKLQGRRDDGSSSYGNSKQLPSKNSPENEELISAPTVSGEQVQRVRQPGGNTDLNNELKLKANELEKLFAEHKLRVPSDQSGSTRRGKPAKAQLDREASPPYEEQPVTDASSSLQSFDKNTAETEETLSKFSTPPQTKLVHNQEYSDALRQNFSQIRFSDDSRGKFYSKYMQKRDAKLKEEWGSRGAEKEAKLKAMQDTLERSRAEMKAKFSGSSSRMDSASSAQRRAEKIRSFILQAQREQHPISTIQDEDDEDVSEIQNQKYYGQAKKLLPNKSQITSRTPAAPAPRSSGKASSTVSGRRRVQSDNPLAQSVPNFSDLRKENTKPSSTTAKTTSRSQMRNYARSKSSNEEVAIVKEEKHRRTPSLRKSSSGSVEFMDPDGAPLKFDKGTTEESFRDNFSKNVERKPFIQKGDGRDLAAEVSISQLRVSPVTQELAFDAEDSMDMVGEDEDEELETMAVEDRTDMDKGSSRGSQESDKLDNSVSENGDSFQVDPTSVVELPAALSSTLQAPVSTQDSPSESPVSWTSRFQHPFSYPHEASDFDASMDSPIGSPASWNSHSLNQKDAEAARMRKKWGSTQKLFLANNATQNQPRKDMTSGFKRLLKFGRKSRGTDSLVDWISATTSEGDDDTEDGRDPANRSSDDLRKSRMGFLQSHPSDDSFNESELFNEQAQALRSSIPAPPSNFKLREDHLSGSSMKAPRSFFSLSTFRSKGSDSKLR